MIGEVLIHEWIYEEMCDELGDPLDPRLEADV